MQKLDLKKFKSMNARFFDNGYIDVFVSYETIVFIKVDGIRYIDEYNYSRTTQKQLSTYLGLNSAERRDMIKKGTLKAVSNSKLIELLHSKGYSDNF